MTTCIAVADCLEHRRQAADHEHAGGDHGRGVDQRADRGRALHRVGKPGVEPELRRLAHRADEQQQAQQGHGVDAHAGKADGRSGHARRGGEDRRDRDGAEHQERAENAEGEAEVADAVDDERLERRRIGGRLVVPEADQQVGSEADAFPAEEHLHQAVGGHQHQHREAEQRQIGEEARLARVLLHIAPAVEVDEAGDGRDDDQHHRGQAIDAQRPVDGQRRPTGSSQAPARRPGWRCRRCIGRRSAS